VIQPLVAFVPIHPGTSVVPHAAERTTRSVRAAQSAGAAFDPNLLYQLKIDNSGDGIEDKVIQITFSGTGANQEVIVRGPVAPAQTGTMNTLVTSGTSLFPSAWSPGRPRYRRLTT